MVVTFRDPPAALPPQSRCMMPKSPTRRRCNLRSHANDHPPEPCPRERSPEAEARRHAGLACSRFEAKGLDPESLRERRNLCLRPWALPDHALSRPDDPATRSRNCDPRLHDGQLRPPRHQGLAPMRTRSRYRRFLKRRYYLTYHVLGWELTRRLGPVRWQHITTS